MRYESLALCVVVVLSITGLPALLQAATPVQPAIRATVSSQPALNARNPQQRLEQARKALTGPKKDTELARKILLDLAANSSAALEPVDRCCVYMYLGYIHDLAGSRQAAIAWFKKATSVIGPGTEAIRQAAEKGLTGPITMIPHLDAPGKTRGPSPELTQARKALTGPKKDTSLARKILLTMTSDQSPSVTPADRCYACVYLGYIEDLAGNRQAAIDWFRKVLAIDGLNSEGIREVAKEGLPQPVTWIRHLDAAEESAK